tara:strand:+ start:293 stop:577 length:285 start_codon:yes stop_codon:yes gene_type:complete
MSKQSANEITDDSKMSMQDSHQTQGVTSSKQQENSSDKCKHIKVGAHWIKKAKDGRQFMSGYIEVNGVRVKIVTFKNDYHEPGRPEFLSYAVEG